MLEEYSKKLLESIKEKGLKPIEEISIEESSKSCYINNMSRKRKKNSLLEYKIFN